MKRRFCRQTAHPSRPPIVDPTVTAQKAHLIGTGLIGTSIALALRKQGWEVAGWDRDPIALQAALDRGALSHQLPGPESGTADLVVLATPPAAVVSGLRETKTEALVTDVAGVKKPVVDAAGHLSRFVGGHPMAGGATTGPQLASASLFHGAAWVLTSDGAQADDIASMSEVVESIGANPLVMTADEHDAAVARISHLPHVLAAILMTISERDEKSRSLAGGGFRDLTRIAAGESDWWTEVLTANEVPLGVVIDELQEELSRWKTGSSNDLYQTLESARVARSDLSDHDAQIEVVLLDQPGEIARVGHALEVSRVDVRDLQLRHGEHGGGGLLTISVRPDGTEGLTKALVQEGFEVRTHGVA